MGIDRVVQMTFGTGENTMHLFLELYSQGNLVVTNNHFVIDTILRTRKHDERYGGEMGLFVVVFCAFTSLLAV